MATVIDELVVKLGLDPTQFTAGQRAAVAAAQKAQEELLRQSKATEEHSRKVLDFFTMLKRQAIETLAVFAGARGVKEFIGNITTMDSAMGRLATTLGVNVEEVSLWANVTAEMGGTLEEGAASVNALQLEIAKIKAGGLGASSLPGLLSQLQIDMRDANGELKKAPQIILELHDALKRFDPDVVKSIAQQIGLSETLIAALLQEDAAWNRLIRDARELGGATKESAEQTQRLTTAFFRSVQVVTDLGRELLLIFGVFKILTVALDAFTDAVKRFRDGAKNVLPDFLKDLTFQKYLGIAGTAASLLVKMLFLGPGASATWAYGPGTEGVTPPAVPPAAPAPVPSPTTFPPTGGRLTRGDRDNNPGNIDYGPWAIAHGAIGADGRVAIFPDKATGIAALDALLQTKNYRGKTLAEFQQTYVGHAIPDYVAGLSAATGLPPGAVPDLSNPGVRRGMMMGIAREEGTHLGGTTGSTTINIQQMDVSTPDAGKFSTDLVTLARRQAGVAASNVNY